MGVPSFEQYTISDHAALRIKGRFAITENKVRGWALRVMQQSHYIARQEPNRVKYALGEIAIIVDEKDKILITVYPQFTCAERSNNTDINPEIKAEINKALKKYIHNQEENANAVLLGSMVTLQNKFQILNSGASLQEFEKALRKVNAKVDKINLKIENAEALINNQYE